MLITRMLLQLDVILAFVFFNVIVSKISIYLK